MDFSSDIFLRQDAGTPHLPGIPLTDVLLVVDGPTAVQPFTLILPIDTILRVTAVKVSGWLAALSGPAVGQADMKPTQRATLLKIVCGVRGFLESPLGVQLDTNWAEFTRLLTRAATRVGPLEPAGAALEPVTTWLEKTFPTSAFMPVYEPYDDPNVTVDNEVKKVELVATLAMMLEPRIREALREGFGADSTASDNNATSPTSPSRGQSRRARKRASQKARRKSESSESTAAPVAAIIPVETSSTMKTAVLDPNAVTTPADTSIIEVETNSAVDVTATVPGSPVPVPSCSAMRAGTPVLVDLSSTSQSHSSMPVERILSEVAKGKRPAATVETDDEGSDAESDDSVPSLQTVSNSTDGEEEYVDDDDCYYDSE